MLSVSLFIIPAKVPKAGWAATRVLTSLAFGKKYSWAADEEALSRGSAKGIWHHFSSRRENLTQGQIDDRNA